MSATSDWISIGLALLIEQYTTCFSFRCLFRGFGSPWFEPPTNSRKAFALSSGSYNQANDQTIQTKGLNQSTGNNFSGRKTQNKLSCFIVYNFFWLDFLVRYIFFVARTCLTTCVCCFLFITVRCSEVVQLVVGYSSLVGYSWWMVELFALLGTQHIIISYLVGLIVDIQLAIVQRHLTVPEGHWSDQQ